MKIAVFVEFFPPYLGSDRRIYELMTRLSKKHEIHFVVLPPFRMLSGNYLSRQIRFHLQHKETVITQHGITAHYLKVSRLILQLWKKSYKIAYLLTLVLFFLKLFKSVKKIDAEVIVLNYPSVYTGLLGFIVGKFFLKKFVLLDFNDLIAQYTICLLGIPQQSVTAKLCVLAQHFIIRNSDKVVVPTDYLKKYALSLKVTDRKIVVIPNGVDANLFNSGKYTVDDLKARLNLNGKKVCLYCGRLDNWAGINILKNLLKAFSMKDIPVLFVIAGGGTETKNVFAENSIVLGEVPYEEVPEVLAIADIVLVPFPNNEISRAASPLKLFEGMAMGKAVVASKVDGVCEVINNKNGVLVNPDDVNEWINTVSALLCDGLKAKKLGENARQTVEKKYDWRVLAEQYHNVLEESQKERGFLRSMRS